MIIIGFGFKVAAVPFHFWAPDVYEGAPTTSAALIASSAKVAGLVIFYQVMVIGFAGAEGSGAWGSYVPGWVPVIAFIAALSIVLGNLVAIMQTSVRRLLAYSAIAHVGYMLLALVSHTKQSFDALLYYALTYALTTIGAFGVVAVVEARIGGDNLSDFSGLSRRAPVLSFCMLIFLAFPRRDSSTGRILRKVLLIRFDAECRTGSALVGNSGDHDERCVALLLPASAQAHIYCRSARRRWPNTNAGCQSADHRPDCV